MVSADRRSEIMRNIKSRDTVPELTVRRLLHRMGFRFRVGKRTLPGNPDIVLARHETVIFIHGCFWHGHTCKDGRRPRSNLGYWNRKLDRNKERDLKSSRMLRKLGWKVRVIWECETTDIQRMERQLSRWLRETARKSKASD
jgi:DNA mismatch endonuclease (patch repair protein)